MVGKVIGQGGFGITYVGWDMNLDIKVAIKEYYPEGCVTRDTHTHISVLTYAGPKEAYFTKGKERFVEEARTLAKFSGDSGIVGVRAFFFENGTAYIVMDYVEGETLKAYAAHSGGKLPAAQVLALFRPLIRSLARVHDTGLLHRDISPDNIMLRPDGTLALLDFGAARQMSVAGEHSNTINVKHGFAPEEQYRTRGEQGPWTDVYALCATIYRLTTGITPTEALDRIVNEGELTPPTQLGAAFTPGQEQAILHGLAVRANRRTRDMRELAAELYGSPNAVSGTASASGGNARHAKPNTKPDGPAKRSTGAERKSAAQRDSVGKQRSWLLKPWPYIGAAVLCIAIVAIALAAKARAPVGEPAGGTDAAAATATPGQTETPQSPAEVTLTGEDIVIGTISPNSGALSIYGAAVVNGVDLAVEEINASGGILGRHVSVVNADDQFAPAEALNAFNSLVSQGVGLIVGSVTSGCTAAITKAADEEQVVLITPSATADSITTKDDYVFRACYADSSQGAIAAYYAKQAGYSDVGVVYCKADSYSAGLYNAFADAAKTYGLNIKDVEATSSLDVQNYANEFAAMVTSGVEFVYAPFYYDTIGPLVVPQARAAGYTGVIMGADGYDGTSEYTAAGADLSDYNNVYWTNHYDPADTNPKIRAFVAAYQEKYGSTPNAISALAYDAMYMLKTAIEHAGTSDPAAVRDALADTTLVYDCVTGTFSMDKTGTPVKGAAILSFYDAGGYVSTRLVDVLRQRS